MDEVGEASLKVQMDFYHAQIVGGDLAVTFRTYIGGIGHVQIAGVPATSQPDRGEVNYEYLFSLMDDVGLRGLGRLRVSTERTDRRRIGMVDTRGARDATANENRHHWRRRIPGEASGRETAAA